MPNVMRKSQVSGKLLVGWLKEQWDQPTSVSFVSEDPRASFLTYEIRKIWCVRFVWAGWSVVILALMYVVRPA